MQNRIVIQVLAGVASGLILVGVGLIYAKSLPSKVSPTQTGINPVTYAAVPTSACQYGAISHDSLFNAIADKRAEAKASRLVTAKSLDTYAQLLADESDKANQIVTKSKYGDYFTWAKTANTNYEEKNFDQAGGWVSAYKSGDTCTVMKSLGSTPSKEDYLVGEDTSSVGIGISPEAVFVVTAHLDKNPKPQTVYVPQQPRAAYVPPPSLVLPTISLPKHTTCRYNSILNQTDCTEY